MKNPFKGLFKKEEETQFPTKVLYRYTLTVGMKNHQNREIWADTVEKARPEEVWNDFIEWYTLKLNKETYTVTGGNFVTVFNRDEISWFTAREKEIVVE